MGSGISGGVGFSRSGMVGLSRSGGVSVDARNVTMQEDGVSKFDLCGSACCLKVTRDGLIESRIWQDWSAKKNCGQL